MVEKRISWKESNKHQFSNNKEQIAGFHRKNRQIFQAIPIMDKKT